MSIRFALIAAAFWPMQAFAIGFPSFSSEIPGVQLWVLSTYESGFPEEGFEDERNEFIQYCDGYRSLYVGTSKSPIRCKSEPTGGGTHRIFLNAKGSHLSGLVVVSTKPLPSRVNALPVSGNEVEKLRSAEKVLRAAYAIEAKRRYMESISDTDSAYAGMLDEISKETTYRKHWGTRYKFPGPSGATYISAIGLFPNGLGWNLKNVVFREIEGRLEKAGEFWGCIEGFRDLDGDGAPEVLTRLCENSEGSIDQYWSLTPTVRPVVERSQ